MEITHEVETSLECEVPVNAAELPLEERISLLEKRKRSLLHELKVLSFRISGFVKAHMISDQGEGDKYPNAAKIPTAPSRRLLTPDPREGRIVLDTFARFDDVKEILANCVTPELEELQKEFENNTKASKDED